MTVPVGAVSPEARKLLDVTKASLFAGVEQMRPGNHLGDVSAAIQRAVEVEGLSIIRTLVGHGIGRDMHEEPQVPNFGEPGKGPELEEGMVLAIEPMVNAGGPLVRMDDDGWSVYSEDGSLAAHFEFTVAVTADGPRILTPWHEELTGRSLHHASALRRSRAVAIGALRAVGTPRGKERPDSSSLHACCAAAGSCSRCSSPVCAAARRRWPQPYGANDAGGFRNVLPPGRERARHTSTKSCAFLGTGACHRISPTSSRSTKTSSTASPTLTDDQIPNYFKDATFGVPAGRGRVDHQTAARA